ncbi:hypothetical protein ACRAWF_09810 [Streptomyces sp. L7]
MLELPGFYDELDVDADRRRLAVAPGPAIRVLEQSAQAPQASENIGAGRGTGGDTVVPRPGGETDKFGNRYEGAWTIRHALYVLLGSGTSLRVEPGGPLGEGIEFVYRHDHATEVHQVKRQNCNANSWNVASLRAKGVWDSLRSHVEAGREFHFVSVLPARALDELADRARRSDSDPAAFRAEWLTDELRGLFDALAAADIYGSAATAWRMLRGLRVEWHDERDLVHINAALAEQVLAGAPGRLATLALGQLLLDNLGTTLDASALTARLAPYGLRGVVRADNAAVSDAVSRETRRWAASIERTLLRPTVPARRPPASWPRPATALGGSSC